MHTVNVKEGVGGQDTHIRVNFSRNVGIFSFSLQRRKEINRVSLSTRVDLEPRTSLA